MNDNGQGDGPFLLDDSLEATKDTMLGLSCLQLHARLHLLRSPTWQCEDMYAVEHASGALTTSAMDNCTARLLVHPYERHRVGLTKRVEGQNLRDSGNGTSREVRDERERCMTPVVSAASCAWTQHVRFLSAGGVDMVVQEQDGMSHVRGRVRIIGERSKVRESKCRPQ